MATPRKKRADASPSPDVSTQGPPSVYDDVVIGLIPALQEMVAWWQERKATLEQASDASRETERTTFHVERRWVEAIRRQADLDGLTIGHWHYRAFLPSLDGSEALAPLGGRVVSGRRGGDRTMNDGAGAGCAPARLPLRSGANPGAAAVGLPFALVKGAYQVVR